MSEEQKMTFAEFWPYYLAEHKMALYMVSGRMGAELARLGIKPKG